MLEDVLQIMDSHGMRSWLAALGVFFILPRTRLARRLFLSFGHPGRGPVVQAARLLGEHAGELPAPRDERRLPKNLPTGVSVSGTDIEQQQLVCRRSRTLPRLSGLVEQDARGHIQGF